MSYPCIDKGAAERNIAALQIERYDFALCSQGDSGQIEHTGAALQFVHKGFPYAQMAGFLQHCHPPGIAGAVIIDNQTSRSYRLVVHNSKEMKCPAVLVISLEPGRYALLLNEDSMTDGKGELLLFRR